ncbi:MAG: hypothetical protein ACKVOP_14405 [Sphingomonadaceae bacterium]
MAKHDCRAVKRNRCYTVPELAKLCHVHKNTVRGWQQSGLKPLDDSKRPTLFHGDTVHAWLASKWAARKSPCPPATLYCFRCRAPRPPALGMVDYVPISATGGNLKALCATCETTMHRRVLLSRLATIMPGLDVQIAQAQPRLVGRVYPLPIGNR